MPFIQKYLFRQMLGPTVVTTLALGGVAVLSSSLKLLNLVVSERQEAMMFVRLVLYSMPGLFAFVIPITSLVATLLALNKLHTEQEIVVCFASGMSRWQVTSPLMRLAAISAVLMLAVNLWLTPLCDRAAQAELFRARNDLAGSLVREGEFTDSPKGLTVYAQQVDAGGVLHNLFVYQPKDDGSSSTFDSRTGIITHLNGAPVLVMRSGSQEEFSTTGTLNFLKFDEHVLDLTAYAASDQTLVYKPSELFTHELFFPDPQAAVKKSLRRKMLAEANARLASPLYIPTFVMFAILAVIGGAFSRLGYGRQIAIAATGALVLRLLGVTVQAACENSPWLNILQYLLPLGPGIWAARTLFRGPLQAKAQSRALGAHDGLRPLGA